MWPRLRLDIGWTELLRGWKGTIPSVAFGEDELACLSVRSAFDLYLRALALPRGSEVLMSALTIPHMPAIVREHGLVPVPVDVEPRTLAPTLSGLALACTPKSKVLVVAHLFGGRVRLDAVADFALARGLLLVEDCAQAFDAHGCPLHPRADAAFFSFGTIKTATALGGAVARVRDAGVLGAMRAAQDGTPRQPELEHKRRLARAAALKLLGTRAGFGAFARVLRVLRRDLDDTLQGAVAGFPGADPFPRLRRRPSVSLERMLARRVAEFPPSRIAARRRSGELLARALPARIERPGADALVPTHWVFPVTVRDPGRATAALREAGFDATRRSSLRAVAAPPGHPCGEPRAALEMLARTIFVPCDADMPESELGRIAAVLAEVEPLELRASPPSEPEQVVEPEGAGRSNPLGAGQ